MYICSILIFFLLFHFLLNVWCWCISYIRVHIQTSHRRHKFDRPRSLNLSMLDEKVDFTNCHWDSHVPIIGRPRKSVRKDEKENCHSNYLHPPVEHWMERDHKVYFCSHLITIKINHFCTRNKMYCKNRSEN